CHSLLRMRKRCVPTRSPATRTSIRVVTKYPAPSFVVFRADTDSVTASKAMSSPGRRGRAYSCSQSVATTAVQPASSRSRSRSSNASVRPVRAAVRPPAARRPHGLPPVVAGESSHRPHLQHGGGRNRVRARVRRVGVPHRLAPVPDHECVDRVPAPPARHGRPPLVLLQPRPQAPAGLVHHLLHRAHPIPPRRPARLAPRALTLLVHRARRTGSHISHASF